MTRSEIYALIDAERIRQDVKHPVFANSHHHALAVLASEFGEVSDEVRDTDGANPIDSINGPLRDELIQVAAVCVRWLESGR